MSNQFIDMDDAIMSTKVFTPNLMSLAIKDMKEFDEKNKLYTDPDYYKNALNNELRGYKNIIIRREFELRNADINDNMEFPILVKELRLRRAQYKVLLNKKRMLLPTVSESSRIKSIKRRYGSNM
jgi:hypothetical protein